MGEEPPFSFFLCDHSDHERSTFTRVFLSHHSRVSADLLARLRVREPGTVARRYARVVRSCASASRCRH